MLSKNPYQFKDDALFLFDVGVKSITFDVRKYIGTNNTFREKISNLFPCVFSLKVNDYFRNNAKIEQRNFLLLSSISYIRRKFWSREKFELPVLNGFARFGMA